MKIRILSCGGISTAALLLGTACVQAPAVCPPVRITMTWPERSR